MTEEESKALNESIRLNERLNALKNNEDFKEIILKRFIDDGIKGNMMALPFAATDDSKKKQIKVNPFLKQIILINING